MKILIFLQTVHIITGSLWLCSFLFMYFILWPSFVRVNSREAILIQTEIKKASSSILAFLGVTSITLGIFRGIYFGGFQSWDSFFTPQGKFFVASIFIAIVMILVGKFYGGNLVEIPSKDEFTKRKTLIRIYLSGIILLICYILLIFCMVAMRYGGI
jgi:uncharacterized membrane protein